MIVILAKTVSVAIMLGGGGYICWGAWRVPR